MKLKLRLDHQVEFGQQHALLGSSPSMGSWKKKIPMHWSESGWFVDLEIDTDEKIEFKFVIALENEALIWEDGPNRVLELPKGSAFELYSKWNDTKGGSIVVGTSQDENGSANAMQGVEQSVESREMPPNALSSTNGGISVTDEPAKSGADDLQTSSNFVQEWQGRNISFMRSNEHNREQRGKWDVSGLEGSALYLVDGDKSASNWWRKVGLLIYLDQETHSHNAFEKRKLHSSYYYFHHYENL